MQITFDSSGTLENLLSFLTSLGNVNSRMARKLDGYGREGVAALSAATPKETGLAASSWDYHVESDKESVRLVWTNNNVEDGFPVVIALQYGYATGTGGYVAGRDFINPALKPIFDRISRDLQKEVTA